MQSKTTTMVRNRASLSFADDRIASRLIANGQGETSLFGNSVCTRPGRNYCVWSWKNIAYGLAGVPGTARERFRPTLVTPIEFFLTISRSSGPYKRESSNGSRRTATKYGLRGASSLDADEQSTVRSARVFVSYGLRLGAVRSAKQPRVAVRAHALQPNPRSKRPLAHRHVEVPMFIQRLAVPLGKRGLTSPLGFLRTVASASAASHLQPLRKMQEARRGSTS